MAHGELIEERLTRSVIGAFFEVYNHGYGFVEHLYVMALERELLARQHQVTRELCVRVRYKGEELGVQRLDMVVDEKIVVETKASAQLPNLQRVKFSTTFALRTSKSDSCCILDPDQASIGFSVGTAMQSGASVNNPKHPYSPPS